MSEHILKIGLLILLPLAFYWIGEKGEQEGERRYLEEQKKREQETKEQP